jgi:hypothetical protein
MPIRIAFSGGSIILVAIIVIGGAFALAAATLFPHATITVHPKMTSRTLTKEILLSSTIETPDYLRFQLPAKIVEKEMQVEKVIAQSDTNVSPGFSTGTVTLTNNQGEEQRLLPKTHLKYEPTGVFFLTDERVVIPPKGSVSVTVTAKEQGKAGDVAPGKFTVDKLPANLQKLVFATSEQPFSGGEVTQNAITQETIDTAQEEVLEQAKQQAVSELSILAKGSQIRPDLVTIEILSQNTSALPGSHAVSFTAEAKVKARAFVIETHDIMSLMTLALRASVESDEEFLSYDPASFTVTYERTDWKTGTARVSSKLTGTYSKKISPQELKTDNLSGLSKEEVLQKFSESPTIGSVDVSLSPFWVKDIPSRQNQIEVTVANTP